ncbi:MAG: hypothetical protein V1663_02790 [archaeon]
MAKLFCWYNPNRPKRISELSIILIRDETTTFGEIRTALGAQQIKSRLYKDPIDDSKSVRCGSFNFLYEKILKEGEFEERCENYRKVCLELK